MIRPAPSFGDTYRQTFGFCLSLTKNRAMAEDLCHATYVRALEKLPELRDPTKLQAWLTQLAKHLFLDQLKSPKNQNLSLESLSERAHPALDPRSTNLFVREVLANLPPEEQVVLLLIDGEGYSYRETAKLNATTEAAVRSRLHRARRAFRRSSEGR